MTNTGGIKSSGPTFDPTLGKTERGPLAGVAPRADEARPVAPSLAPITGKEDAEKADKAKQANAIQALVADLKLDKLDAIKVAPTPATSPLGPCEIETVKLSGAQAERAYHAGEMLSQVLLHTFSGGLADVSGERMLAEFMKLEAMDPMKKPETMADLYESLKNFRKASIENEKGMIKKQEILQKEAIEEAKEAKAYANSMQIFSTILTVIAIVAAIVATVATYGTAGPGVAVAVAVIVAALATVANSAINMNVAAKNYEAMMAAAEAEKAGIAVEAAEKMHQFWQEMVEESQEIMQAMMESVNQFMNLLKAMITRKGDTAKILSDATMRS